VLPVAPAATVNVRLQTSLGPILLLVEKQRAPITAANFLRYVDQKRLDGCGFYRAMTVGDAGELGLVQAGLRGNPKQSLRPIAHEPTTLTGLSHVDGALSMARAAPGTATSDFFIVLGDLTSLDAKPVAEGRTDVGDPGYAVFGHVVEGMDVVRAISQQPRSASAAVEAMKGQMLEVPVRILTARRVN
jgi:peptidyl-prolyl cis-trans isomerase A (cyclophilin A)